MFEQGDAIRDFVFPIAIARKDGADFAFQQFLGTGFLIGNRGFGLTAAHVVREHQNDTLIAMFQSDKWQVFQIKIIDVHTAEDVALVRITASKWRSIFHISNEYINSSLEYHLFGYPEDALHEQIDQRSPKGIVLPRPDLIYSRGHIRRRISWNMGLPGVRGNAFVELSAVAGSGCSGSPVFKIAPYKQWPVIGLYVGERTNDRSTSVGYATRAEAFADWSPSGLGWTVFEEAQKT